MAEVLLPVLSKEDPGGEGVVATWLVANGHVVAEGQLTEEAVVRQGQPVATVD